MWWDDEMKKQKQELSTDYLFGDTETSGLSFLNSNVIEIGLILTDKNLDVKDALNMKVNLPTANSAWDKEAEGIHKISYQDALVHGVSQLEAIDEVHSFLTKNSDKKSQKGIRLVGANSYFDYVMLTNMWEKNGRGVPPFSHRVIDLGQMGYFAGCGGKLHNILKAKHITTDESQTHSAGYDAMLHYQAFCALADLTNVARSNEIDWK